MKTTPLLAVLLASTLIASVAGAATEDLGNGFLHHGVATPVSCDRGIVATVDGQGRNVVLVWLYDHRGSYALLMIDAETGKAEQYPMPFAPGGDCPFASILSSGNKYYTHFNGHFCEFDPAKRAFTFHHSTVPQMAMSMTEDDNGVIWSATYPQSGIASFNPKTGEFKDYGQVHKENWAQYPRSIAADDTGCVYFAIGSTRSHIIGLDPATGKIQPMIGESDRVQGAAEVYRATDGKVYGSPGGDKWLELYKGQARSVGSKPGVAVKPIIAGSQTLFHKSFPDGTRVTECNLVERRMIVEHQNPKRSATLSFDYTSEGAHVLGVAAAPDHTICGGTAFPMRFFSYDPNADRWLNRASYGQWNTIERQGDRFFVGGYTHGFLLEWDPAQPWVATQHDGKIGNPRFLTECSPDINRPHALLALPDSSLVVLGGTPGYGYTGGGLLIWERKSGQRSLLKHTELIPQQSTMSLLALPDGKILAGTTTSAGTGGEKKASLAELYVLDPVSKKMEWHAPVLKGVNTYADLCTGPKGLVYGIADYSRFFVFDPARRKVVHEQNLSDLGRTCAGQGPQIFVTGPDGSIYILLAKGIARIEPATFKISLFAQSPVPIHVGGDYHNGRIYFASGSHVYSYTLPKSQSRPAADPKE